LVKAILAEVSILEPTMTQRQKTVMKIYKASTPAVTHHIELLADSLQL